MVSEFLGQFFAPLRVLHALAGVLLIAGLLGRWVALQHAERAARAGDLSVMRALLSASGVFERTVIVTSLLVIALGLLTAWSLGFPLLGFFQGGSTNWLLTSLVLFIAAILLVPTVFIPRGGESLAQRWTIRSCSVVQVRNWWRRLLTLSHGRLTTSSSQPLSRSWC